jgi:hypothetical protein
MRYPFGRKLKPAAVVIFALAVACAGDTPTDARDLPEQATQVPIERPAWSSQLGGFQDRTRIVIRDAASWSTFWSTFARTRVPPPEPPQVEFESNMVVVAALGRRSTAGFQISVDTVHIENGDLHVTVREVSPASGCIAAQMISTPVTAVVLPAREGDVEFVEVRETRPCQ